MTVSFQNMCDQMGSITISRYLSPAGELMIGSIDGKLCICDWKDSRRRSEIDRRICRCLNATYVEGDAEVLDMTKAQLDEYFDGRRKQFSIPLLLTGTEFQREVWRELEKIPYGTTISYAVLASRIGNPKAVRAVASANAVNAVSIIIPCHRVIGSNHTLTGYGGGLEAKQWLLAMEKDGKWINENGR